jgi:hypothetical protein
MDFPRPTGAVAMTGRVAVRTGASLQLFLSATLVLVSAQYGHAQRQDYERAFPQSKAAVEKALKELRSSMAGRLPALEGFAVPGGHPLDRYHRGYYQTIAEVTSTASGGALVRVSTKVTAWYSDSAPARSGYQLLKSNGRLEADLLDQLADQLAGGAPIAGADSTAKAPAPAPTKPLGEASISPPVTKLPETSGRFSSFRTQSRAAQDQAGSQTIQPTNVDKRSGELKAEAESLEEILKNQSHPKNLVAVKKPGTPVVATPSLNAKVLFLASVHDEFEMLDFNQDWVHVRISGLSRGWIWRDSLEMPDGIPDGGTPTAVAPSAADLFRVAREENSLFPGDWGPLRGKSVKIVSIQKADESVKDGGAEAKLEFAKFLLDKHYAELAEKSKDLAGIVLIFDSADGGMIATTVTALQQWKAGILSDAALWHQCFFDPPETFGASASSANR